MTQDAREKLLGLCARPQGVALSELDSAFSSRAGRREVAKALLLQMCDAGEVFARRSRKGWRFFATEQQARDWNPAWTVHRHALEKPGDVHRAPRLLDPAQMLGGQRRGQRHAAVLPGTLHGPKRLEPDAPVLERDVPVTICPGWTHDPRFQCAPGERPAGAGFAAMGRGRFLDETAA